MRLAEHPDSHLTYCTNIHPGESWEDVFVQLKNHLPELKKRVSPESPFGVGLRLSAVAARQLLESGHIEIFKKWLDSEDLYVFTLNGFPYGNFHGGRVKDQVYVPDWSMAERREYTSDLVAILTDLLPDGIDGGISTSPVSYKFWGHEEDEVNRICLEGTRNLARIAFEMANVRKDQGKELHLDIEPEPDCFLENSRDTVAFFSDWLFSRGSEFLSGEFGMSVQDAKAILQFHIRVCYDTCHFAVEFEDPETAIRKIRDAGIRIGKTQISAALRVPLGNSSENRSRILTKLKTFDEPVYLHQVVERRSDGSFHQYRDLPEALANISSPDSEEWRIHFHVPVFVGHFDGLDSTRDDIERSVSYLLHYTDCKHFEVETYTWEVLPDELKSTLPDSIERELKWAGRVLNRVS